MTPKERLQEAAHKLAGSAEYLEDVICPTGTPTFADPYGLKRPDPNTVVNGDMLPQKIREGLKAVRKYADEIEKIVK